MNNTQVPASRSLPGMIRCFLLILILFGLSQTARAQDFDQLMKDGNDALYKIGIVQKSNVDEAIADYTKAIELKPDNADAFINRGRAYLFNQTYDQAIADYTKVIELKPDNAEGYNGRGEAYRRKGDYGQAIADYSRALELKPMETSIIYYERGNVYYCIKDYDRAIADFNKAIESRKNGTLVCANHGDPNKAVLAQYYGCLGEVQKDKGAYQKAIEAYTKAIELAPEQTIQVAYYCIPRGEAYDKINAHDKAMDDYNKAKKLNPAAFSGQSPSMLIAGYYRDRGYRYLADGKNDYKGAIEEYSKAIAVNPDDAEAYMRWGDAYFNQKDFEHAIENYTKVIELTPTDIYVFYSRGSCYRSLHNYEQAIADYSKAIEIRPSNPYSYSDRAYCYVKRGSEGDNDRALADFQKAAEMDPASVQNVFDGWMSASISQDLKDKIKAVVDKKKGRPNALAAGTEDAEPLLNEARSAYAKGDYDLTITDCGKVIELIPNEWKAYFGRGNAYFAKKDYDKAIADYSKVIELKPDNANAYSHRAICYTKQGAGAILKAMADFKKAANLDPASVQDILDGTIPVSQELKDKIQQMVNEKKGQIMSSFRV